MVQRPSHGWEVDLTWAVLLAASDNDHIEGKDCAFGELWVYHFDMPSARKTHVNFCCIKVERYKVSGLVEFDRVFQYISGLKVGFSRCGLAESDFQSR